MDGMCPSLFSKLTDFDLVPQKKDGKAYHIKFHCNFAVDLTIKPEYKIYFGFKPCGRKKCKQTNASCTCKTYKGDTPPCPVLADKGTCQILKTIREVDNAITKTEIKDKFKQRTILKHLSNYDHYKYFNTMHPLCINGTKCNQYLNVLNGSGNDIDFEDKLHLHLYYHKPPVNEGMEGVPTDLTNNKNHGIFEYVSYSYLVNPALMQFDNMKMCVSQQACNMLCNLSPNCSLFFLIQEVIRNDFIQDLKPQKDTCDHVKRVMFVSNPTPEEIDFAISVCKKELKIFDELEEKMKHERCKNCPFDLLPVHILPLLLYCNGECNHDLCKSQINGTYQTKWPYFDGFLNFAISALGAAEVHFENLYSGLCNVALDIKSLYLNTYGILTFKTNVSFSSDVNVAKEFRGAEGMILGLNMSRDFGYHYSERMRACEVSWLSKYPTEREVLVAKGSEFTIDPSKSVQIGKNQYVILHNSKTFENTFQKMFLM